MQTFNDTALVASADDASQNGRGSTKAALQNNTSIGASFLSGIPRSLHKRDSFMLPCTRVTAHSVACRKPLRRKYRLDKVQFPYTAVLCTVAQVQNSDFLLKSKTFVLIHRARRSKQRIRPFVYFYGRCKLRYAARCNRKTSSWILSDFKRNCGVQTLYSLF